MPTLGAWRVPVAIALGVVVVDQSTKHWAVTWLGDDRTIDLVWTLRFNLTFNNGMAFGQAGGLGPVIAADAQAKVMTIDGIDDARVELVWDPACNQEMISEEGKMKLGMI